MVHADLFINPIFLLILVSLPDYKNLEIILEGNLMSGYDIVSYYHLKGKVYPPISWY